MEKKKTRLVNDDSQASYTQDVHSRLNSTSFRYPAQKSDKTQVSDSEEDDDIALLQQFDTETEAFGNGFESFVDNPSARSSDSDDNEDDHMSDSQSSETENMFVAEEDQIEDPSSQQPNSSIQQQTGPLLQSTFLQRSKHARMVTLFSEMAKDPKTSMKFTGALRSFAGKTGRDLEHTLSMCYRFATKVTLDLNATDAKKLDKARPNIDGKRYIRKILNQHYLNPVDDINEIPMDCETGGYRFETPCVFMNVQEAFYGFVESDGLRQSAPWNEMPSTCDTLRQNGAGLAKLRAQFFKQFPECEKRKDFVVFYTWYSDSSIKQSVDVYPLMMSFPHFDQYGRVTNIEESSILLGWIPVGAHIKVTKNSQQAPLTEPSDSHRTWAMDYFRRQAIAHVLEAIVATHNDESFTSFVANLGTAATDRSARIWKSRQLAMLMIRWAMSVVCGKSVHTNVWLCFPKTTTCSSRLTFCTFLMVLQRDCLPFSSMTWQSSNFPSFPDTLETKFLIAMR